jgi:hypothetical protein
MVSWQPHPLVVSFLKMKTIINFLEAVVWNTMKGEVKEKNSVDGTPRRESEIDFGFHFEYPHQHGHGRPPGFPAHGATRRVSGRRLMR